MILEASFFADEVARFGVIPGVTVRDITAMSADEISTAIQSPGTAIGTLCYSGASLGQSLT